MHVSEACGLVSFYACAPRQAPRSRGGRVPEPWPCPRAPFTRLPPASSRRRRCGARPRIRGLALPFDRNGILHLVPSAWLVPRGIRVRDSPASLHSSALYSLSLPSGVCPVDTPQVARAPVGGRQGHFPFSGAAGCCERLRTSPTGLCFCFSGGKNQRSKWPANFFKNCQPQFSKAAVPFYLPASNA